MPWKPFLRQLFISTGAWSIHFIDGLTVGLPTVLLPQLRKANQTISDEAASWLPSLHTYSAIPWVFVLTYLIASIGRKKTHFIVCVSALTGSIVLTLSTNITHVCIAVICQGAVASSPLITSVAILTEFVSVKNRGMFLSLKCATVFWGVLVANTIGTFFYWKHIATLGIVCSLYSMAGVLFWPESPLWLASKGKVKECSASHRWLKGKDLESEKELNRLLNSHDSKLMQQKFNLRNIFKTLSQKRVWKAILLSCLLVCLHILSGKVVSMVYALDILKKVSSKESYAYSGMLILDGVTVASMYMGCFLSRIIKRRVMVLGFTSAGIFFLTLMSGYLFLSKFVMIEKVYVSIVLLAGYSISISCGSMIMTPTIISELIPMESRSISMCVISITTFIIYGSFIKIFPRIFKSLTMPGTFALFACLASTVLILIYIYLPETKDKTLQEISDLLYCKKSKDDKNATGNKESKKLINK